MKQRRVSTDLPMVMMALGFLLCAFTPALAGTFLDSFDRPDGPVGNGWVTVLGHPSAQPMEILNERAVHPSVIGWDSGISHPFPFGIDPIQVEADISSSSGDPSCPGTRRFTARLLVGNDGVSIISGYGICVSRSDNCYSNSTIHLWHNGSIVAFLPASFQFETQVHLRFVVYPDGSLAGDVTEGTSSFAFSFGPRAISLAGGHLLAALEAGDNRNVAFVPPSFDNIFISGVSTCRAGAVYPPCRNMGTVEQLFAARDSRDADGFGAPGSAVFYDSTSVTITKASGDRFYLSGGPTLAGLVCDDEVFIETEGTTVGVGLGPYQILDDTFPRCAPIESILAPLPYHEITGFIPAGTNCVTFKLGDTQREVYGNTDIYLIKEPGAIPVRTTTWGGVKHLYRGR